MPRRTPPIDPTPTDHHCIPRDSVDRLIADWRRVRPDLDFASVAIVSVPVACDWSWLRLPEVSVPNKTRFGS